MSPCVFSQNFFKYLSDKWNSSLFSLQFLRLINNTENPHTVLHGRFLINQCFGPLNEPGFNFYTYYGFLSFNFNKPGGEINRKNYLKITKNFLKLIKFIRNIPKIFSWKEFGS